MEHSARFTDYILSTKFFANDPIVAVDVGVRGGFESFLKEYYGEWVRLIGFDGDPDVKNEDGLQGKEVYPIVIAQNDNEKRDFFMTAYPAGCSLFPIMRSQAGRFPLESSLETISVTKVITRSLSSVMKEIGVDHIDYLKMDVEGGERDVLLGMGSLLNNVSAVSTEALFRPMRIGQSVFRDIDLVMSMNGFFIAYMINYKHTRKTLSVNPFPEDGGETLWAQVLYFNDIVTKMRDGTRNVNKRDVIVTASMMEIRGFPDCAIEVIQTAEEYGIIDGAELYLDLLTPFVAGQQVSFKQYWSMKIAKHKGD